MGDGLQSPWARAIRALELLSIDPVGLGGLWLRARSGPVRDRFLAELDAIGRHPRKLHPGISDEQLFGGLDLAATLDAGRLVQSDGVLARPGLLLLTMAERCPSRLAAHLGQASDAGRHQVVALDEGAEADELAPAALTERLGLFVALDDIPAGDLCQAPDQVAVAAGRAQLAGVRHAPEDVRTLVELAAALGIGSLRAPRLAVAAARANASFFGRDRVTSGDLTIAAELVLAHRATVMPEEAADPAPEPHEPQDSTSDPGQTPEEFEGNPPEVLMEAVRAALPPDVLNALAEGRASRATSGAAGSGARKKGNRRGRPLPSRTGLPGDDRRIDLVATLRAAAPWQTMRRAKAPPGHHIHIRRTDIRVRQFQETSDRLLVFAVDASGSQAMTRLAEAKGAVEQLLAQAYARRDHVALIAFRGQGAELLLPPTRSLVQTKRRLQALPGGGGTPLAAGLHLAADLAEQAARQGMTPTLALLTDGRANIALDGRACRQAAREDADRLARAVRASGTPALVIDTSPRPRRELTELAVEAGATYLPLPRADAGRLSSAVSAALSD